MIEISQVCAAPKNMLEKSFVFYLQDARPVFVGRLARLPLPWRDPPWRLQEEFDQLRGGWRYSHRPLIHRPAPRNTQHCHSSSPSSRGELIPVLILLFWLFFEHVRKKPRIF